QGRNRCVAASLFAPPGPVAPRKPPAPPLAQPIPRQTAILADPRADPREAFCGLQLLTRRQGLHDPNATSSNRTVSRGAYGERSALNAVDAEVAVLIDRAVATARAGEPPADTDLLTDVY